MEPVADNYQLKWHSFASYLHASVAASVANEHFADAALFTVDGHRILAHRFILSTSSQYFHQILKLHHKLNSTLPIMIIMPPEISYKTLKTLIQYMYSGETTVSKDILEHVLRGGDILKIRGLWRPKEDEQEKVPAKPHQKQTKPVAAKEAPPTENRKLIYVKPPTDLLSTKSHTSTSSEPTNEQALTPTPSESNLPVEKELSKNSVDSSNNQMQYLVIKEEPLEWSEVNESEMELVNDMFHTEMTIKPEICLEQEVSEGEMYSPLTCELCTETFKIPGEWVKHIQTHTDMLPAKRRRGKSSVEDDDGTFPPLQCHMCEKYFPTPAEWVHHIQNVHSETEMRMSNKQQSNSKESRECAKLFGRTYQPQHKVCSVCYKKFPSHASMLIHRRTHTGEKPYMCRYCSKGFNVKSNLLRHLRTLHDKIVNSSDVADVTEEDGTTNEEENQ